MLANSAKTKREEKKSKSNQSTSSMMGKPNFIREHKEEHPKFRRQGKEGV